MKEKTFQAAVYLRLSREDGDVTDGGKTVSNSIANQNELVVDYLKSHPEIIEINLCLSVPHNFPICALKVPHWCIFSMDFGRVIFTMGQANGTQHRLQSPFSFAKE